MYWNKELHMANTGSIHLSPYVDIFRVTIPNEKQALDTHRQKLNIMCTAKWENS